MNRGALEPGAPARDPDSTMPKNALILRDYHGCS